MGERTPKGEGSVYQRASDGKWCASVTLPSGRRKTVYGEDEKAALKARRKLLQDMESGRPVSLGRTPKLADYLNRWLDVRIAGEVEAGHLDENTANNYRDMITGHILSTFLAKVKITQLTTDDIRAWQRDRLRAHTTRSTPDSPKTYSPRTVGLAQATLRRALNDAVADEGYGLSRNVAALVNLPAGQSKKAPQPSEEDLSKVFAEMITDKRRALWLTMLALGERRGEALGMRWSLTDLDAASTKLRKQVQRIRGEVNPDTGKRRGRLVEKDLKTDASKAALGLPPSLVEVLRVHKREQAAAQLAARRWADADLIFTTSVGTALEPRNVNRDWDAVCERAGVKIRLHDLRHAAASLAFAEGASMKEVQALLRHTRESTTSDIYVEVFESVRRGTTDRMDTVLKRITGS
jgi:integrase